ncbi:hypothetical protein ILUMI_24654, partial [Ignelater luminosus]
VFYFKRDDSEPDISVFLESEDEECAEGLENIRGANIKRLTDNVEAWFGYSILTSQLLQELSPSCYLSQIPEQREWEGKSHFDVFEPLMKELAKKGHRVTVISHFPQKKLFPNYEDVNLKNTAPILVNTFQMEDIKYSRFQRYYEVIFLSNLGVSTCLDAYSAPELKTFLKTEKTFDLIIVEFFNCDCFLGLVHKLKSPFIGMTTSAMLPWNNVKLGNPTNPSYIANAFLPFTDKMWFLERLENAALSIFQDVIYGYSMDVENYKIAKSVFGDNLPPLREIAYNASLLLVNSHFSLNRPKPLVPAVIEVGGIHIGKPKQLPQAFAKKHIDKWHEISQRPKHCIAEELKILRSTVDGVLD